VFLFRRWSRNCRSLYDAQAAIPMLLFKKWATSKPLTGTSWNR
jgi:hypothetical protein